MVNGEDKADHNDDDDDDDKVREAEIEIESKKCMFVLVFDENLSCAMRI